MSDKFDFVTSMPGLVIAKDINSTYLAISQEFARLLGWKSAHECSGVTDFDIPCKASQFASDFVKMDKKTIDSGIKMVALDIQNYSSGWKLILVERNPLINEDGKSIGLFNQCIDVSKTSLFRAYLILHRLDSRILGKKSKPISYTLSNAHSPLALTEKQENCLFLIMRGKTLKEVAKILNISPRTAEDHIEAIKNKLHCQHKSEIIEIAINSGFLYYVPKSLQDNRFDKIVEYI